MPVIWCVQFFLVVVPIDFRLIQCLKGGIVVARLQICRV